MPKTELPRPAALPAEALSCHRLLDTSHTLAAPLLEAATYPFEILPALSEFILSLLPLLPASEYAERGEGVLVSRSARVSPLATLEGPCIVGAGCELRPGAYLRGAVLLGEGVVIGNSSEVKNAVLLDGAAAPHYNYVGDSLLGYRAHLGAGAVLSNLRADRAPVTVRHAGARLATGLRKFGAVVGDYAEVGCNAVLCPGTVLGRRATVYPTALVRGTVPEDGIVKRDGTVTLRRAAL
ncbi:MAG: UDP-N-acetylglucosamine pyrophosphorylase [Clostridia bacterium]|nr:UDP-N-acetylglucosamine pyrophosphorylase [Clostridia bacterium]